MFDRPSADRPARAPRPRDAATLIIADTSGRAPRVLMGLRHAAHAFMPEKVVFPGGRVEAADHRLRVSNDLRPDVQSILEKDCHTNPRALALAALRETFEETGLVIGTSDEQAPITRSHIWEKFLRTGSVPRLDVLDVIARAVTPPYRARRFDARFFLVDARHVTAQVAMEPDPGAELLELAWLTLDEARARDLPAITRRVLDEVEARLTMPGRTRPVPFFRVVNRRPIVREL